jgi:acyl-CoA synthetase (AMP-forming)/AMP-acid ligase II
MSIAKNSNIAQMLSQLAQRFPDKEAFITLRHSSSLAQNSTLTFAELERLSNSLAVGLTRQGLTKGDRVLVMIPMSAELYLVLIALFKVGAIAVFIDPWVGLTQLARCCELTQPKAFIGVAKAHLLRWLSPTVRRIPLQFVVGDTTFLGTPRLQELLSQNTYTFEATPVNEDDPALITFTTGSTGLPKGAERTHGFLMAQHEVLSRHLAPSPEDRDLPTLPVFVLNNLANGITSVFPEMNPLRPADVTPSVIVHQIQEFKITTTAGSPAFFRPIAEYCLLQNIRLKTLHSVFIGGAPVPSQLIEALTNIMPQSAISVVYGSTEAEPISLIRAEEILSETAPLTKEGLGICVGKPVNEIEVRIIQMTGNVAEPESLTLPIGTIGEITVTGRHVNQTYYKNPEAIRENKIRTEQGRIWHRTGDAGYLDERGRLWLVGRVKNRVVRAGAELHPLQIEPLIDALPFVARSALIGLHNTRLGQKAVLIVEPTEKNLFGRLYSRSHWESQIIKICHERGFPIDEVHFCRRIPVDPRHNAKIDHALLRRRFSP